MERETVLAKFFYVNETLKAQKNKNLDNADKTKEKINHTSKAILCNLLVKKSINQRSLASLLSVSPQAISESIKKLDSLGLINKTSGSQKNENLISLTENGEIRAKKLREKILAHSNAVFKDFSTEELEQLYNLLDKISG